MTRMNRRMSFTSGMRLAVCLLLVAQATSAFGQRDAFSEGFARSDLQFFSPVDFDFNDQIIGKDTGWSFSYDKLSWSFTGDNTVIGDQSVVVLSQPTIGPGAPGITEGAPPAPFVITNSIQDAPPQSTFAWGERYEFGYRSSNGSGWVLGILDGPEARSVETYGFQNVLLPNSLPTTTPNNGNFSDFNVTITGDDGVFVGSADTSTSRNGFGSVFVNFRTPLGFLLGFQDFQVNGVANSQGPAVGGPGRQVVASTIVVDGIDTITFTIGGDGIIDDLDGDGGTFIVSLDAMGNPIPPTGVDFDDLVEFNIAFDNFTVRNTTETQGIELMRTLDLDNSHRLIKNQNLRGSWGYGVRYLRLQDEFFWEGLGGILGRTFADTKARNSIVGPQLRGNWSYRQGRWDTNLDTRVLLGVNFQDLDQAGTIGEDLLPGGVNTPFLARPTAVRNGDQEDTFAQIVEFRAQTSYQITSSLAARLGYTALFVDGITRSSQVVDYALPTLGILDPGRQEIFINGVNFGFDVNY